MSGHLAGVFQSNLSLAVNLRKKLDQSSIVDIKNRVLRQQGLVK